MKPYLPVPVAPPLSPLAEVVLAFEGTEPDACALLQPFTESIGRNELEVRARRKFPQRSSEQRNTTVEKALELLELARQGKPAPRSDGGQQSERATISPVERERLRGILENAFTTNPALTATQARTLLAGESAIRIPTGTFYGTYWRPVIARLPSATIKLRNEITERRPGNGKLDLTDKQREEVRRIVAEIKRDNPEFHPGQIMDEVRRTSPYQFSDPVSFNRYYVQPVNAAPARARRAAAKRSGAGVPANVLPVDRASRPAGGVSVTTEAPIPPLGAGVARILTTLDPLSPAQLTEDASGQVRLQMNFSSTSRAAGYRMLGLLYSELADIAQLESL